jgi:protein-S-isoprenylcysteine O-methyltransferase Ste14
MGRASMMAAAVLCYAAFSAAFVYLIGFVAGFDALPTHVDKGRAAAPATAAVIDLALIALFGIQHSVMARQGFKAAWTRIVSPALERAVYCLASAVCLILLFTFWHPIAGVVWSVDAPAARVALWVLFWAGWGILFVATHLINHWEMFGLAQAWRNWRGQAAAPSEFRTPLLYRFVRHPIYTGFLLALWATPDMSVGHLVLAAGLSVYIFIGIAFEERDLMSHYGAVYGDYRTRVGTVFPGLGRRRV